jgi:hypothetical protein
MEMIQYEGSLVVEDDNNYIQPVSALASVVHLLLDQSLIYFLPHQKSFSMYVPRFFKLLLLIL